MKTECLQTKWDAASERSKRKCLDDKERKSWDKLKKENVRLLKVGPKGQEKCEQIIEEI